MKNRIKELRAQKRWSQDDLAKKIKTSRQTISLIERQNLIPSVIISLKIAKIFSKNVEEIFILENED